MATIKSYTSLEQSKKLAKILPLESADMFYVFESINGEPHYHPIIITEHTNRNFIISEYNSGRGIVSWSLAALLGVIPNYKLSSEHNGHTCTKETPFGKETVAWFDNPVDACYEMILKLHEKHLL